MDEAIDHRLDPTWAQYPETILEVFCEPVLAVDLRRSLGAECRLALQRLGLGPTFSVITASNPAGRVIGVDENARRAAELAHRIAALGIQWLRADGVSPDGMHREEGVAVGLPVHAAKRLAIQYQQSALFHFDGDRFWLVPALLRGQPVPLPMV